MKVYALNLNEGPHFGKMVSLDVGSVTALFRDGPTDTLYAALATAAQALFSGTARQTATWTKRIVFDKYETFAWLAVESDFTDADGVTAVTATVTIANAAGATLYSVVVSSRDPVRLAAFREPELVVTVASKARVTAVRLASTTAELKAL